MGAGAAATCETGRSGGHSISAEVVHVENMSVPHCFKEPENAPAITGSPD